jgi:hypothetical protein
MGGGCVGTCGIAHRDLGRVTSYHRCLQIMHGTTMEQDSSRYCWSACGMNSHDIVFTVFGHVILGDTKSAACGRHARKTNSYMQCAAVVTTDSCGQRAQVCNSRLDKDYSLV